jgi:hypothetical protein
MWKFVFSVTNVIFKFESPKKKTHKVRMNNDPYKNFKKYDFGTKKLKNKQNCNSYGLIKIWSNFNHSKVPNY